MDSLSSTPTPTPEMPAEAPSHQPGDVFHPDGMAPVTTTNNPEVPSAAPTMNHADMHPAKAKRKFPTPLFLLTIGLLIGLAAAAFFWIQGNSRATNLSNDLRNSKDLVKQLEGDLAKARDDAKKPESYNRDIRDARTGLANEFRKTLTASELDDTSTDEVTFADINLDLTEDALIVVHKKGSKKNIEAAVYTMKDGKLSLLFKVPAADVLNQAHAAIGPGQAITYSGTKSATATAIDTFYVYKWNNTTFTK